MVYYLNLIIIFLSVLILSARSSDCLLSSSLLLVSPIKLKRELCNYNIRGKTPFSIWMQKDDKYNINDQGNGNIPAYDGRQEIPSNHGVSIKLECDYGDVQNNKSKSLDNYSHYAREYWKEKLGEKYSTSAVLKRLVGIVIPNQDQRKVNFEDPFLDLDNIESALHELGTVLPKGCNVARIVSRYPALLREVTSLENGKKEIRLRVESLQRFLPGIQGEIDSEDNGYGTLLERVPTRMFLKSSANLEKGSILDEKIDLLAQIFFPITTQNIGQNLVEGG